MPQQSGVQEFIAKSKSDPKMSSRIMEIFATHGSAAAKEILQLATDHGFSFSQSELEETVRGQTAKQMGGEAQAQNLPGERLTISRPPMSSCARGCLSYTHSWHPEPIEF
jgi:hypothetical protein